MFCRNCSFKHKEADAKFCTNCGARLYFGGTSSPLYSQKKHLLPLIAVAIIVATMFIAGVAFFLFNNDTDSSDLSRTIEESDAITPERTGITLEEARKLFDEAGGVRLNVQNRYSYWIKSAEGYFYNAQAVTTLTRNRYAFGRGEGEIPILDLGNGYLLVSFCDRRGGYEVFEAVKLGYAASTAILLQLGESGGERVQTINGIEVGSETTFSNLDEAKIALRDVGVIDVVPIYVSWSIPGRGSSHRLLTANNGETITIGYFQGTQFVERDIISDRPIYALRNVQHIGTSATRDGYFVKHIEDIVSSGLHIIRRIEGVNLSQTPSNMYFVYIKSDNLVNHDNLAILATIRYNANGGTGAPENHTVYLDNQGVARFNLSTIRPTKNGYTFLGWRLENSTAFDIDNPGQSIVIYLGMETTSATLTYYAQWSRN